MIKVGIVVIYINVNKTLPAPKVEITGDLAINNLKIFFCVGTYFNGNIIDEVFFNFSVIW